jgi:P27 family predicted phage terminase small subunit
MARHPKPTELHIIDGTFRPDRHENRVMAEAVEKAPRVPSYFDKDQKKVYKKYFATLKTWGITLAETDVEALFQLIQLEKEERELLEFISSEGYTQRTEKGKTANAHFRMLKDTRVMILNLRREFGFTPVSRARVRVDKKKKESIADKRVKNW